MTIDSLGKSPRNEVSSGPDIQRFLEDAVEATAEFARRSGGKFVYSSTPERCSSYSTRRDRPRSAAVELPAAASVDSRPDSGATGLARWASCWSAGRQSANAVVYPDTKARGVPRKSGGKTSSPSPVSSLRRSFSLYTRSLSSRFS